MITFKHHGDFRATESFLRHASRRNYRSILENYGREGVAALASATPKDTGKAASSWDYAVDKTVSGFRITWTNSNVEGGTPVVILIQYGHGTRGGTFVEGRDFINPAIQPIFDRIATSLWKEVTSV